MTLLNLILSIGATVKTAGLARTVTPPMSPAAHLHVKTEACAPLQGNTNTTAPALMVSTLY